MNKNNKKIITICFFVIIFLGLFIRLYNLESRLLFVYDQGRDALKIAEILKGKLTLIGATTGLQGFFLGPFFYYFITPWYALGGGNPIVPAYFLQFFNFLIGGFFIYKLLKKADKKINICLVFFTLAFSYYHWNFSKWLSNPSPLLTFAPLYFYLFYYFLKKGRFAFLSGLILAICLQTEFSNAVFFIPVSFFLWLYEKIKHKNKTITVKKIIVFLTGGFLGMSPLVLFNFRHENIILNSLLYSFSETKNVSLLEILKTRPLYVIKDTAGFVLGKRQLYPLLFLTFIMFLKRKKNSNNLALRVILFWLFIPLVFIMFYTGNEGNFWDYYLIAQYLAFLLVFILFLSFLWQKQKLFFALTLSFFLFFNLRAIYYGSLPETNKISLANYKKTIDRAYEIVRGESFNVEVYVPNLQPKAYEYLFDWYGNSKYAYGPSDQPEKNLIFVLEPGNDYWRNDWLKVRENDGILMESYKVGIIDIQKRKRKE